MKGPGFLKKLSLRNLNNIQINEPIDKNSEESNDLIHITTPSNIINPNNANKKIFYGLSKNYLDRRHNSREENIREKKLSVEDNFNKISAHKKQDIKLFKDKEAQKNDRSRKRENENEIIQEIKERINEEREMLRKKEEDIVKEEKAIIQEKKKRINEEREMLRKKEEDIAKEEKALIQEEKKRISEERDILRKKEEDIIEEEFRKERETIFSELNLIRNEMKKEKEEKKKMKKDIKEIKEGMEKNKNEIIELIKNYFENKKEEN